MFHFRVITKVFESHIEKRKDELDEVLSSILSLYDWFGNCVEIDVSSEI